MKAQSVLRKYITFLNWEKERTSIQLKFLKLNPLFTTYFGKSPHMENSNLHKTFFENQNIPP